MEQALEGSEGQEWEGVCLPGLMGTPGEECRESGIGQRGEPGYVAKKKKSGTRATAGGVTSCRVVSESLWQLECV